MRFNKRNEENKRIAAMLRDELAGMLFQKSGLRNVERQLANQTFGKRSVWLVRSVAPQTQEPAVITNAFGRNPIPKSTLSLCFVSQLPLSHVSGMVAVVAN